ncbi:Glc8p [Sugiyamaella lignohabitans]|uniref:Glc8p n=1 Tax=Sugiyamaella lignohabitans TaxID=796027 RepID=A0A167C0X5_9ASCO|nr:Glc8p [Sugiyamaella lignohabitans]ANB11080.1 Glc8p [Sugiyamaella lignohabitans]
MSSPSPTGSPRSPHFTTERRRSSASSNVKPKSILRNAPPPGVYNSNPGSPSVDSPAAFDRQAVLENTRANAKLNNIGAEIKRRNTLESGDQLTGDLDSLHNNDHNNNSSNSTTSSNSSTAGVDQDSERAKQEHLKWDEANLYLTEQEKAATMKITEPKTPYQGAVGDSEYYLPDEEDDVVKTRDNRILSVDELDGFSLGESVAPPAQVATQNDRILYRENDSNDAEDEDDEDEDDEDEEEEEEELTPEERHRRFEELRKSHYHMKAAALHTSVPAEDDDEDDEN